MKTRIKLIALLCFISLSLISCDCKKCERELSNLKATCDDCKTEKESATKKALDKRLHPKSAVFCNIRNEFQLYHVDMKSGYMIVGKILNCYEGNTPKIQFELFEAGNCKRYEIVNVECEAVDRGNEFSNLFTFEVNKLQNSNDPQPYIYDSNCEVPAQNLFKMAIISDDERIIINDLPTTSGIIRPLACPIYFIF